MSDVVSFGTADGTAAVPAEWFCDQCGARYPEPGQCDNQHPPADLQPVPADEAAPVEPDSPPEPAQVEPAPVEDPAPLEPATPAPEQPAEPAADPLDAIRAAVGQVEAAVLAVKALL